MLKYTRSRSKEEEEEEEEELHGAVAETSNDGEHFYQNPKLRSIFSIFMPVPSPCDVYLL